MPEVRIYAKSSAAEEDLAHIANWVHKFFPFSYTFHRAREGECLLIMEVESVEEPFLQGLKTYLRGKVRERRDEFPIYECVILSQTPIIPRRP